jgi:4-hydroxybenzoate polyprenyltransferase
MKTADLLDLLRIPNVTTAASDVMAAGALVAATGPVPAAAWARWAAALLGSAALYCAGMALNDVADAPLDRAQRPTRPIPSGRIARATATRVAMGLLAAGLLLVALAGRPAFAAGLLLACAIVLYDLVLSGRPLAGPLGMAACRGLNMLMGLLALGGAPPAGLAAIAILVVYLLGLTHLSLGEVEGSPRAAVRSAVASTLLAAVAIVAIAFWMRAARPWAGWVALGACLLLWLARPLRRLAAAAVCPQGSVVGPAVGALVSGILWLDASLAAAASCSWAWLAAFAALGIAQELLRRSFRVT